MTTGPVIIACVLTLGIASKLKVEPFWWFFATLLGLISVVAEVSVLTHG